MIRKVSKKKEVKEEREVEGQENSKGNVEYSSEVSNIYPNTISSSAPSTPPTQFLTADDILTSCGAPLLLEIPELPRNGKPGIVYLKRPSAGIMVNFWASRNDENRDRETIMSELIGLLTISEDGSPLFSPEQVSLIREARYDVWQRLASGVDSIIKPISANVLGENENPFEGTEEAN